MKRSTVNAVICLSSILTMPSFASFSASGSNVTWTSQSADAAGSMPIGNGDIGANVWVQGNVIHLLVSKTDACLDLDLPDDDRNQFGLPKLCKLDIVLSPNPFSGSSGFSQTVDIENGEIVISQGTTSVAIWVDANNPVIRVHARSSTNIGMTATVDNAYGLQIPRTLTTSGNSVVVYHRNSSTDPVWGRLCKQQRVDSTLMPNPYQNRTFGCVLGGNGFTASGASLSKGATDTAAVICISALTKQSPTPDAWVTDAKALTDAAAGTALAVARSAHRLWWSDFWKRSWIDLGSTQMQVTRAYNLQRYITACGGRGAQAIKFNGSIFTFDDFHNWGDCYWFQNTRETYWPLLSTGDYDCLQPLFNMYTRITPILKASTKNRFPKGGMIFPETMTPFGLWDEGEFAQSMKWTHFNGTLELMALMLDYYDNTRNDLFAQTTIVPYAREVMTFWDVNFGRDAAGKLSIPHWTALETCWDIENPACDLAGLRWNLDRLLSFSSTILPDSVKTRFARFSGEIPSLAKSGGLLACGTTACNWGNSEQPQLYSVFPFRIYGLDKPGLDTALATFAASNSEAGGWQPGAVFAALLGDCTKSWQWINENFNPSSDMRFPAFWGSIDGRPQQCSGGIAMYALQKMLVQTDNGKIHLFGAWDKSRDADFRLWLPNRTIIEGTLTGGILTRLAISPLTRKNDIVFHNGVTFNMANVQELSGGTPALSKGLANDVHDMTLRIAKGPQGLSVLFPVVGNSNSASIALFSLKGQLLWEHQLSTAERQRGSLVIDRMSLHQWCSIRMIQGSASISRMTFLD